MADGGTMPPWLWWGVSCVGLWLLYRIYELLKAIHFMLHDEWQHRRNQTQNDELQRAAWEAPD